MDMILLEKENRAFDLYINEAKTFDTIAKELGYANRSGAQKAYLRARERFAVGDRKERIEAELQRFEILTEFFWPHAKEGNIKAVEIILQIADKKLKYLSVDAPVNIKAEVVNYDGVRSLDAEVIELARVIDYIEGISANITTVPDEQNQGKPNSVAAPSEEGTTTP